MFCINPLAQKTPGFNPVVPWPIGWPSIHLCVTPWPIGWPSIHLCVTPWPIGITLCPCGELGKCSPV